MHRIQDEYSITPLSKFGTAYKPARPGKIITKSTNATIPGTQPGEDPLAFYTALGKEMLKFPAPAADRAAAIATQDGRHRPRAQSRERAPQRRHAPRPARRRHPGPEQGPVRRTRALPPGVRQAQRLPHHRSRRLGHELHAARDRRQARRRRPAGEHRDLPGRAVRRHQGTTHRIKPVRHSHPEEQPADPGQGVLVADDVRQELVLRPQPAQPLPDQQPLAPAHQPRRLDRHLHPARQAVEPAPGEQLAARARARTRIPSGLAAVRPRPRPLRRARRLGLAAATVQPCDATGHAPDGTACAS